METLRGDYIFGTTLLEMMMALPGGDVARNEYKALFGACQAVVAAYRADPLEVVGKMDVAARQCADALGETLS